MKAFFIGGLQVVLPWSAIVSTMAAVFVLAEPEPKVDWALFLACTGGVLVVAFIVCGAIYKKDADQPSFYDWS